MTIREALLAQAGFLKDVPVQSVDFQMEEVGLNPDETYTTDDRKNLDIALAGLFLFIATQPVSIKELDWGITNISVSDLMHLRRGLLRKWGIDDDFNDQPEIKAVRLW